jgi:hypothetical protein
MSPPPEGTRLGNVKQHGRPETIILAGQRGLIVAG